MTWLAQTLNKEEGKPEDWYGITKTDFAHNYGAHLLTKYQYSPYKLFSSLYPDAEWIKWGFARSTAGFWDDEAMQREYLDWLGQKLGYSDKEGWYGVRLISSPDSQAVLHASPYFTFSLNFLQSCFSRSLHILTLFIFPISIGKPPRWFQASLIGHYHWFCWEPWWRSSQSSLQQRPLCPSDEDLLGSHLDSMEVRFNSEQSLGSTKESTSVPSPLILFHSLS